MKKKFSVTELNRYYITFREPAHIYTFVMDIYGHRRLIEIEQVSNDKRTICWTGKQAFSQTPREILYGIDAQTYFQNAFWWNDRCYYVT